MEPTGGPVAAEVAAAEATRTATPPVPHKAATTPARRLRSCGLSIENAGGNNDTK
jgi:hypothetical protein